MSPEASWRYPGWGIVGLSFVVLMASYGLLYVYSVFVPFLAEDLGLSRAAVAAPFSLCVMVYASLSLVSGRLTDRLGPRPVVLTGGLLMAAGFAVLAVAKAEWHLFLGLGVLYGVGMCSAYIPTSATLVRWFLEKRGLAVGLANLGGSVAMAGGPLVAAVSIQALGWRDAALFVGILGGGLTCLAALGLRFERSQASPGQPSAPVTAGSAASVTALIPEYSWPLAEARRTRAFWLFCAVYLLSWSVMFFPFAHFFAFAVDRGWGADGGTALFLLAGGGGATGRIGIGWLSDRFGRKAGILAFLAAFIAASLVFAVSAETSVLYAAAVLFGIGAGASVALYPAVIGDLFGRAHVGAIAGFAFAFTCTGGALGPLAAGWIRDHTGSYADAFLAAAAANLLALVLALFLQRPAPPASSSREAHLAVNPSEA